jgi:hypothetical protein
MTTSTTSDPIKSAIAVPAVHGRAIIVDGHCDTPYRLFRHNLHLDEHDTEAQLDLKSLRESGITASFSRHTFRRSTQAAAPRVLPIALSSSFTPR